MAQQAEMTGIVFPEKLRVRSVSLIGSHTMPGQQSQQTPTLLGPGYVYLGVTCHLQLWHNDRGLLHTAASTWGGMGME